MSNKDKTYFEKKLDKIKKDQYLDDCTNYIYSVFHFIMVCIAALLLYRCNPGEQGATHYMKLFLILLCPHIYIIYILATYGTCNV
jgi:hypothetical protein